MLNLQTMLTRGFSILPALAFALDMFQNTGSNYGVNEVLLASVLGSVVFSLFAAQPLVIVGVTGVYISDILVVEKMLTPSRPNHSVQLVRLHGKQRSWKIEMLIILPVRYMT